jgi:serine/threonine-protein kinase
MADDVFGIVGTTQGGSFRVERAVAEGGFSVVYRAQHGAFRAPVALKCLKIPGEMTPAQREAFLEKFREEAEILFRLSASIPEVVRPLHVDTLALRDGRFVPFLALEWLDGEALDEMIYRRREAGQAPMGPAKLVKLLRPVARGLSRAHRFPGPNGMLTIVHRDIKPENILIANVNGQEVVKLLDFGISIARRAAARRAGTQIEQASDTMNAFTPRYGAPEQWDPETWGEAGPWTDVWSLAITMAEALAGRAVVDGDIDQMRAIVFDRKRRPTPRNAGVVLSDAIEDVFLKALAIDPRERTRDIEAFWSPLEKALGLPLTFARRDVRAETARTLPPRADGRSPISEPPAELAAGRRGSGQQPRGMFSLAEDPAVGSRPRGERVEAVVEAPEDGPRLELDLPRGRASRPAPPGPPSSGRAVLPPPGDDAFEPLAQPVSGRGRLASSEDIDLEALSHRGVGQGASLAPPPPAPLPEPEPVAPLRPRPPRPSSPSFDHASTRAPVEPPAAPASIAPEGRNVGQILRLPIGLLLVGLVVMAIDRGSPEAFAGSPIRPIWVAMVLLILGLGMVFWRLLSLDSEH